MTLPIKVNQRLQNLSDAALVAKLLRAAHPDRAAEIGSHVREHIVRFRLLFAAVGSAQQSQTLLDVGGTGNLLPMYLDDLGYPYVAMANKWRSISLDPDFLAQFFPSDRFRCDYFDAEAERFPYNDASFDTVVCSEVIEHLKYDPAHLLREINRVLKPGGRLILSTPNITSDMALYRLLSGRHPQVWSAYTGIDGDRHNREYTPGEIRRLLQWAGFRNIDIQTFSLETIPLGIKMISYWTFLPWALRGRSDILRHRGEYILAASSKEDAAQNQNPVWLYD
jgi:2-polyprenyl-3-methyl-5-hydroxy-6-metoxy-1,4-benzoquinol methylase